MSGIVSKSFDLKNCRGFAINALLRTVILHGNEWYEDDIFHRTASERERRCARSPGLHDSTLVMLSLLFIQGQKPHRNTASNPSDSPPYENPIRVMLSRQQCSLLSSSDFHCPTPSDFRLTCRMRLAPQSDLYQNVSLSVLLPLRLPPSVESQAPPSPSWCLVKRVPNSFLSNINCSQRSVCAYGFHTTVYPFFPKSRDGAINHFNTGICPVVLCTHQFNALLPCNFEDGLFPLDSLSFLSCAEKP